MSARSVIHSDDVRARSAAADVQRHTRNTDLQQVGQAVHDALESLRAAINKLAAEVDRKA